MIKFKYFKISEKMIKWYHGKAGIFSSFKFIVAHYVSNYLMIIFCRLIGDSMFGFPSSSLSRL